MKKFEFRLASVLRLRETQLTIEKNKLQQLFAERQQLEKNLRSIEEERREAGGWVQMMTEPTSSDLRSLSAFLLGSKARESVVLNAIASCNAEIDTQRQKTLLAERNEKLLLNLKAKRLKEWQYQFDKELGLIAEEAWQAAARSK